MSLFVLNICLKKEKKSTKNPLSDRIPLLAAVNTHTHTDQVNRQPDSCSGDPVDALVTLHRPARPLGGAEGVSSRLPLRSPPITASARCCEQLLPHKRR